MSDDIQEEALERSHDAASFSIELEKLKARALEDRHAPEAEPILQFFRFDHLPGHLAEVSESFSVLAHRIVAGLPRNPERTVALRKLLEAKDAAVRARLFVP